jgi:VWFA-related protein
LSQKTPAKAPSDILLDVSLVPVDFTVSDAEGKAVVELFQYDFEILDNGEPVRIQHFSRVKTPYSSVVLLDCSESTRPRANLLISTIARFADHLRPEDKIVIAAFGTEIETVIDWNVEQKPFSIPASPKCHGTNFYDTLEWSVLKLQEVSGRKGVIFFTDGRESDVARKEVSVNGLKVRRIVPPGEDRDFQRVLKIVRTSGARFYFVAVDTDRNPGPEFGGAVPDLQQVRARMELLAKETGGRIIFPNVPGDAAEFFPQIRQDLGIGYTLDFEPTKSKNSTPHKIEIRVRGEDKYTVHQSRESYIIH